MRRVALRTRGHERGPITRLISPGDLGQRLKPFVFLDLATPEPGPASVLRWHPHSGIATVTVLLAGEVSYRETTGTSGRLQPGAVEWMASNGGVWHTGAPVGHERLLAFQLWIALPPERESLAPSSQYLSAQRVPRAGPARVILGEWDGVRSPLDAPAGVTYLDVRLAAGEQWTFDPPSTHDIAWLAVYAGSITCAEEAGYGELLVFEEGQQQIRVAAPCDAGFVIGSARKHPHELHVGPYSVHTSAAALSRGEAEIGRIGAELREVGTLT